MLKHFLRAVLIPGSLINVQREEDPVAPCEKQLPRAEIKGDEFLSKNINLREK